MTEDVKSNFGTFDMEMLGITEDDIEEHDTSEAEVVNGVMMPKPKKITVTFRADGVTFNTTCVRCMIDVVYIEMSIDRVKQMLYVVPAEEFDRDSERWCNVKNGKRVSKKIASHYFGDRIFKLMGWSKAYSYRVTGYPARQQGTKGEYLIAFELKEFQKTLLTEKGLMYAGVTDEDLGEEATQIHAAMAEEKARKDKAKEEAAATGKKVRVRRKVEYYKEVEEGAFGTKRKDHKKKIDVKTLDDLEKLGQFGDTEGLQPFERTEAVGNVGNIIMQSTPVQGRPTISANG